MHVPVRPRFIFSVALAAPDDALVLPQHLREICSLLNSAAPRWRRRAVAVVIGTSLLFKETSVSISMLIYTAVPDSYLGDPAPPTTPPPPRPSEPDHLKEGYQADYEK